MHATVAGGTMALLAAVVPAMAWAGESALPFATNLPPAGPRTQLAAEPGVRNTGAKLKPQFRMSELSRTIHGGVQVSTLVVMTESNKFSFLPLGGWHTQTDSPQKKIQLSRFEGGSVITIGIDERIGLLSAEFSPEMARQKALQRFPSATIVEECALSCLGRSGPAFDLEWRTTSGARRRTRIGFLAFAGGHLECMLTGPPETVIRDCQALNQLLLTFRHAPLNGTLDLPSVTPE
ncbi:MAG: hypothetical protein HY735_33080 [Verrucomicrobia bacterium]|nr:hypothetical protein [Verrucomicrobiota bacterium]